MLVTALAQLRLALALGTGRPVPAWALDRLLVAARDTVREFGPLAPDVADALSGPGLDPAAQREVQLRRFRTQAKRAAAETTYYAALFRDLDLDPAKLTWDQIATLPLTPKEGLRDDPDAFVRRGASVALRTTTSGTTGKPTQVAFSAAELRSMMAFSALGFVFHANLGPADVVVMATSSRATLGNLGLAGACAHVGALLRPVGIVEPAELLSLLAEDLRLPGKKPQASVLSLYPSYLGELVETGLARGYRPSDFGLERIHVGGEVVTAGLRRRALALFGDAVRFETGYAMTETFPLAGMPCEHGHLHFEPSRALVELLDPDTGRPCEPGQVGTIVVTPFPPFRETTLLLRFDTQDLARRPDEPLTCRLKHLPATTDLLGKRRLAVRHNAGWTTQRDLLEALEDLDQVPLPARCGFRAVPGGVAVEALVRTDDPATRRAVFQSLDDHGVPVRHLDFVTDRAALCNPLPLRCDLKELGFAPPSPVLAGDATRASSRSHWTVPAPLVVLTEAKDVSPTKVNSTIHDRRIAKTI